MKSSFPHLLLTMWLAGVTSAALAQASPYVAEQQRSIKALSERDIADLQSGQGMGLAKSAELHGYPGPAHVLELAEQLQLTPEQLEATKVLLARHKADARQRGERLIATERELDLAFSSHHIDQETIDSLTQSIGRQQAQLRAEHLRTHLVQTEALTPEQVARYGQLRGYAAAQTHDTAHVH